MMLTRVVPMYFAKIDYKLIHIPFSIIGNTIGGIVVAFLIFLTRLTDIINNPLIEIVEIKLNDNILSLFIMAIFCGILVAYSSLTSRKYRKGSFAQLFYTAIFIATFVICGFDHIVANAFFFSIYGFINGFTLKMIPIYIIVLLGNILGGIFVALVERKNLNVIETRRYYNK